MIAHVHALAVSAAAACGPQVLGDSLTLLDGEEDEAPELRLSVHKHSPTLALRRRNRMVLSFIRLADARRIPWEGAVACHTRPGERRLSIVRSEADCACARLPRSAEDRRPASKGAHQLPEKVKRRGRRCRGCFK